ncbi:MAG TPA: hypothetical protein VF488_04375, partial [Gemmatimonadaceae bacterium]
SAPLVKSNADTVTEDERMIADEPSAAVEARLNAVERQLTWWRRATLVTLVGLAIGGTMAFRQPAPGALEGSTLTLRGPNGSAVALSLRPSGDLELRFSRSPDAARSGPGASGVALVNPAGREVLRIGEPSARQLAP